MSLWARAVLALSAGAFCITLRIKVRWRVAKPQAYQWGPLLEIGQLDDYGSFVNDFAYLPPFTRLPFTYTLSCEPGVSMLLDRFDWKVSPVSPYSTTLGCGYMEAMPWQSIAFRGDPRTVWAVPHGLGRLLKLAERHLDPSHNNRTVHFAGTEQPLEVAFGETPRERSATVARLRKYFRRIVYQTSDQTDNFKMEGVHLAPMGLSWGYIYQLMHDLRDVTRSPQLAGRMLQGLVENASRTTLADKTKGVLATRSRVAAWLDENYTLMKAMHQLGRTPPNLIFPSKTYSSARSIVAAYMSRKKLRWWATTPDAARAGVDFTSLPGPDWWRELPKYRFLLNPMGSAVQTAKTYEALLSATIPIIMHNGYWAFFELVRMGFPLVLVNSWMEVTPENLERWWKSVSPRMESFRDNCLTQDGYWAMITGTVSTCK